MSGSRLQHPGLAVLGALCVLGGLVPAAASAQKPVTLETSFELAWFKKTPDYEELLRAVSKKGVKPEALDAVLARVKVTDRYLSWVASFASPISRKQQNARVRSVMHILLSEERLALGVDFAGQHRELLQAVSEKYGVTTADLLGMLNAESKFGTVQGDFEVVTVFVANVVYLRAAERSKKADYAQAGALSKADNNKRIEKRRRYAMQNLATLLAYAESRDLDPMAMTGSWAGAIGMTQFMPASMHLAVDGDEDGVIDLSQAPDAVASTANYLVRHGYLRGDLAARRKAFAAYNPNQEYVNAIVAYSERIFEELARAQTF